MWHQILNPIFLVTSFLSPPLSLQELNRFLLSPWRRLTANGCFSTTSKCYVRFSVFCVLRLSSQPYKSCPRLPWARTSLYSMAGKRTKRSELTESLPPDEHESVCSLSVTGGYEGCLSVHLPITALVKWQSIKAEEGLDTINSSRNKYNRKPRSYCHVFLSLWIQDLVFWSSIIIQHMPESDHQENLWKACADSTARIPFVPLLTIIVLAVMWGNGL